MFFWTLASFLAGMIWPRLWVVLAAAAFPVIETWIEDGLGTVDRQGNDNWVLVILPVLCIVAVALAGAGAWIGTRANTQP
jgi:membrane protein DedA with SNARE-associated domain